MNNQDWKQLGWRKRIGRLILLTCAIVSLVIGFLIPPQQFGSIPWEYVIIGVGLTVIVNVFGKPIQPAALVGIAVITSEIFPPVKLGVILV